MSSFPDPTISKFFGRHFFSLNSILFPGCVAQLPAAKRVVSSHKLKSAVSNSTSVPDILASKMYFLPARSARVVRNFCFGDRGEL